MSFLAYQPIVDKLKYDDLRMLITYLASIPRSGVVTHLDCSSVG